MLRKHNELVDRLKIKFSEITYWPEITLTSKDKEQLQSMLDISFVNNHSFQIDIPPNNHSIIPSQYILYAIAIKEFALLLFEYMEVVDEVRTHHTPDVTCNILKGITPQTFTTLDLYSQSIAIRPFSDLSNLFESKSLCNGTAGSQTIRGSSDFFSSTILKIINIPDTSSSILGKIIYKLAENKEVYNYFEKRFLHKIPFVVKNNVANAFIKNVLTFLYQYDNFTKLVPFITVNPDPNYSSVTLDSTRLTSIFITSATPIPPANIGNAAGQIRCFEDPIFIDQDNKFVYLSTEWTASTGSRLHLANFQEIICKIYPEFKFKVEGHDYSMVMNKKESYILNESTKGKTDYHYKNILLKGVPGTGKSHLIDKIISNEDKINLANNDDNVLRINIHSASSNSDLMQGIGIATNKKDQIIYAEKQGLILHHIKKAITSPKEAFVIVLEEVQENSLNELIGDLIYLIEKEKRTNLSSEVPKEFESIELFIEDYIERNVKTHYIEMPYLVSTTTKYKKMILPDNLYIYCTSNYRDDKKVIEDNLLRRFDVIEVFPEYKATIGEKFKSLKVSDFLESLNNEIVKHFHENSEIHPDRFMIGHANWLNITEDEKPEFYRALLKVVIEFKDIKELDFNMDFLPILSAVEQYPFGIIKEDLKLNNYQELIKDLRNRSYPDIFVIRPATITVAPEATTAATLTEQDRDLEVTDVDSDDSEDDNTDEGQQTENSNNSLPTV